MEGLPGGTGGKESSYLRATGSISGQEDPLEEGMATHSSILAWRIPWTEEPGELLGSQRVRHDWSDLARAHIRYLWNLLHAKYWALHMLLFIFSIAHE